MSTPTTIFDFYDTDTTKIKEELNKFPFGDPPILIFPGLSTVDRIFRIFQEKINANHLNRIDILVAYQQLNELSIDSCVVCGHVEKQVRCGGIMDKEVSAFGYYYQCRSNPNHRVPA